MVLILSTMYKPVSFTFLYMTIYKPITIPLTKKNLRKCKKHYRNIIDLF